MLLASQCQHLGIKPAIGTDFTHILAHENLISRHRDSCCCTYCYALNRKCKLTQASNKNMQWTVREAEQQINHNDHSFT